MKKLHFVFLLFPLLLTSCSNQGDDMGELTSSEPVRQEAAQAPLEPEKIPELKKYVYSCSQERDPFVPLAGGGKSAYGSESDSSIMNHFATLELRGILKDHRGKIALIGTSSGDSYTLRSGRIYDRRNRLVNEVTGIIKENSVVLISQNKAVKELPIMKRESSK
jgi:Tfp pilus assembly protein PilP